MNPAPRRAATILDVAAAAGVSRQTVTRALHEMPGIAVATRERVLAAAAELDYRPSRFGRGLVKPGARTLGLLVADLANPYYPELASRVLREAGAAGWHVVLAEPGTSDVVETGVDAVLSFTGRAFVAPRGAPNLPVVEVGVEPDRADCPGCPTSRHARVRLDLAPAVHAAVAHLVAAGVRSPVLHEARGRSTPSRRVGLFRDAFAAAGIPVRVVPAGTATPAGSDAVVAFNDVGAFGVLRELRQAGVAVPESVRVVGVDGLTIGRYVTPRPSTLALDMAEVATVALEQVFALAEGRASASGTTERCPTRRVEHRFVVGESG
ncbi:LacI family DNA-binding transcriptional regulator [Kineococcus gynurae]|uniref:LacI family DNA-binding transcriptional regulator n=1 Tax=Kineococcus gynurae TaxID=452979 RepID=A0ABV5LUS6_9ACTN